MGGGGGGAALLEMGNLSAIMQYEKMYIEIFADLPVKR